MKRGLAGAVRAIAMVRKTMMVRKTVMMSNDDDNHDDGDDNKGQMLPIAKMCCRTHKSKN